jgi:hypothetical protein
LFFCGHLLPLSETVYHIFTTSGTVVLVITKQNTAAVVLTAALVRTAQQRLLDIRSFFVLIIDMGITLLAGALGSLVGLYAGSVVADLGYTPAFSAVFRSLMPLALPDRCAELIASIYVVTYLAFSLPAIIA